MGMSIMQSVFTYKFRCTSAQSTATITEVERYYTFQILNEIEIIGQDLATR